MIHASEVFGKAPNSGNQSSTAEDFQRDLYDIENPPPSDWPKPMGEAAFHGPIGDYVRLVSPQSEADPHALLLTGLVTFGARVGHSPHFMVESTRHGVNEFLVLTGDTAKGRKGTATDRSVDVFSLVDPEFMKTRKVSGLSSGEGLIQAVRDERKEDVLVGGKSEERRFEYQVVDPGIPDKRLLIVESEFSSVLQQIGRDGNILSATLRDSFDGKPLRNLARSNKDSCQEPHIVMIGNITIEEVQRLLTTNDKANGFGNRILWCATRRSRLLPLGGKILDPERLRCIVASLRNACEFGSKAGRIEFDPEAEFMWDAVYRKLSQPAHGIFGSMTARAEPHTRRIATQYALLDCSPLIRKEHLAAAVEVWLYCEDSVRYIFGDALGDETADTILRLLRDSPDGLTQTQISKAFNNHKPAAELSRALGLLEKRHKVTREEIRTDGAPVTRWRLYAKKAN
jgi:hypothetical protein